MRPDYRDALQRAGILRALAGFDPHVVGTPPLGLDLPESDIDVLCHAPEAGAFAHAVWEAFGGCAGFALRQWVGNDRPVVASFESHGWRFELFGQARPVAQQDGWRHFRVERRLLDLGGAALRDAVMRARRAGAKTEPAFAAVLRLPGDPYRALLDLERQPDAALRRRLADAGFRP